MFEGTALEQETFELKRARTREEWTSAYTPFALSTWEYDNALTGFTPLDMLLHETSHAIETFENPKRWHRLLKKNYGFETGQLPPSAYTREMWVMALQHFLAREIFGVESMTDEVCLRIRNAYAVQVDVTVDKFRADLQAFVQLHECRGLGYYLEQWKSLCAYVAANRKPPERDLVKELLGFSF